MKGQDILSLSQFDKDTIALLFSETEKIMKLHAAGKQVPQTLQGRVIALLFFEPSSRTFGSFSSAVQRLGGATIEVRETSNLSLAKGESFRDTIKTFESYSDGFVIRHAIAGAVQRAAEAAEIPVINAGDGGENHPTQGLLDLYTLHKHLGRLNNLKGVLGRDPLNSRTIHSVLHGLSMYKNNEVYLLSVPDLKLSDEHRRMYEKNGLKIHDIHREEDVPKDANFWYWNRLQKERFVREEDYKKAKEKFILTSDFLKHYGNKELIILDPLPRVEEISEDVDSDPRAVYFEQMRNGLFVRMALLSLIFG